MNKNIDMTLYGILPSGYEESASMEGAIQVHFDDGDRYYHIMVRHDGTSLSTDREEDSAIHLLMEHFVARGNSVEDSQERAWEVVREATRRMYLACKEADFTPDGLEKFEAV